jgi:hypothetical protein
MVARIRHVKPEIDGEKDESLVITLRSKDGAIMDQVTANDPTDAARRAVLMLGRRAFLHAGDTLMVSRPPNGGGEALVNPRSLD